MATTKITKAQKFSDIIALLDGEPVQFGLTVETAKQFIHSELELLAKKNGAKSGKQTDKQKENETYKELIVGFLSTQSVGVTCTEIGKGVPELTDFNNQKVSALMRALVSEGKVNKEVTKSGKSLFTIA